MRTSFRFVATCAAPALAALAFAALPAAAEEFDVPEDFPTIQLAIAAVEAEAEDAGVEHHININVPVIATTGEIVLDEDLGPTRRLTIRPGAGLERATILSLNGTQAIIRMTDASNVTIQDLDILRNTTNAADLINVTYGPFAGNMDNTIERCRVGSVWTAPGAAGFTYVRLNKPIRFLIRNCIFFSYYPGTFDVGIFAFGFTEPDDSLQLCNNVVADYKVYGILINDAAVGSTLVLRNNVVLNRDNPAEPWAYRSNVAAVVNVASSHNVAFASPAVLEQVFGAKPISGPGPTFLRFNRDQGDDAFDQIAWVLDPEFDNPEDNEHLFELTLGGVLHDDDADRGLTLLADGAPHAADRAVLDDWEKDLRPSGVPLHTDRGADQAEGAIALAAPVVSSPGVPWLTAERNPAQSVAVLYRAPTTGRLTFDVLDVLGRRLHRTEAFVGEGETGRMAWPGRPAPGVYWVRAQLTPDTGPPSRVTTRVVVRR